jgi:hypothetical protein
MVNHTALQIDNKSNYNLIEELSINYNLKHNITCLFQDNTTSATNNKDKVI